ncbi:MAG: sugar phosphate isomerase/epimerase family protein [Armatimonadota bacterium]|jgi:sugar phosphate isomerase/epimerase
MKLGFMLYSLGRTLSEGGITLPQAFALMKETGAEGVDLSLGHLGDASNADVKQMVADAGLVTSCYIGGASLATTDPAERQQALDACRQIIDNAAEVGAPVALLTVGTMQEGQERPEARRIMAEGLAELLPHGKAAGVTLTIEDFGSARSAYQTGAEVLECCELAGPDMMITYDSGNMIMGDEDPVAGLNVMAPRTVHAHAKDWELLPADAEPRIRSRAGKRYVGTIVGTGVIDYPAVIGALRNMNYEGFLSFEYEGRGDQIEAARQGMAYLRGMME